MIAKLSWLLSFLSSHFIEGILWNYPWQPINRNWPLVQVWQLIRYYTTIVLHKKKKIYKSWLNYKLYFVSLGFLMGFGLKSQQYLYLIIREVKNHLLAQQHIEKRRGVCYLSWFGQWYHVWSICWLLSIDQCLVGCFSDTARSYWISCRGGYDSRQAARIKPHRPVKHYSFVLGLLCSPKWLF